ncbi:MAG: SapC family protein [Aliarcobacter sp.]|nr:SapC family protein [Aliarcobacter sp.]
MYKKLEVLNKIDHKNKGVSEVTDFLYSKNLINAPIAISEFFEACKNYPIFFSKDKDEKWFATVLLGYKENENIFVDKKGVWKELHYIPAFVRSYPFILSNNVDKKELLLAVEKESLTENKNSKKLFDENGNNSEFLNGVLGFLNQFYSDTIATSEFIKQLESWELLEEKVATVVNSKNEKYSLNGFFIVNEEKLKHLSKKKKDDICAKNAYALITAHLISLSNIHKLGSIK